VIMSGEVAPALKAMLQSPDADSMTCFAVLDAATHHVIVRISHVFIPQDRG